MARNRKARKKRTPAIRNLRLRLPSPARMAAVIGPLAVLALLAAVLVTMLDRPIRRISAIGEFERVSAAQVEAAVGDLDGQRFLSADLEALRLRVTELVWVDQAVVRRRWPDTIEIDLTEQIPAARWRERGLLNVRGELFVADARHVPAELPRLAGPEGSEATVAEEYLRMRDALAPRGLSLVAVELDSRGAWRIELGTGLEVRFGRLDLEQRFNRFLTIVTPLLASFDRPAVYVDLRYSKGFSVAWPESEGRVRNSDPDNGTKVSDKDV
jgi:cell division protein FtsQ